MATQTCWGGETDIILKLKRRIFMEKLYAVAMVAIALSSVPNAAAAD